MSTATGQQRLPTALRLVPARRVSPHGNRALGGGSLYVSNVTFNTSAYTLTNGMITLPAGGSINVAAGQSATINAMIYGANTGQNWNVASNATLNVGGNAESMQVMWLGGGTVNLAGINTPSIFWANTMVNQIGGSVTPGVYSFIGYSGGPGIYTLNAPSASLNVNGGTLNIARGGQTGTLTVQSGTVNIGTTSTQDLSLASDNNNKNNATVNILGGTLNVGAPGIASLIQFMPGGGSSLETATLNISGGTVNAQGMQFGSGNAYSGGVARLTLTNGSLYVGSSGIIKGANLPATSLITLSGGTVGASANWSSTMPMTLANGNGYVTFQAADAGNNAHNITLSGILSGTGGLTKTGAGILTLSATNTYTGGTTNNVGTLIATTSSSAAGAYSVAGQAVLDVQVASAGTSLKMSALTLNADSALNLDLNSIGNPTAPIITVSNALTPASTATISFSGTTFTPGQFPLIKYGSLGGAGFGAFVLAPFTPPLGPGYSASLVNNTNNQSIDLNLTYSAVPMLKWDGTVNDNWDICITANWKTNADYTESNGAGPVVIFDDSATGPNTAIVLDTNVAPLSVVVSNSVLAYSLGGSGGIGGTGGLLKAGTGMFILGGNNSYTGGTTITAGALALTTTNNPSMVYTINGGTLKISMASLGNSLEMSSLMFGKSGPQLTLDFQNLDESAAPAVSDGGKLTMNGNVAVNLTNLNLFSTGVAVLLRYAGARSGTGSFVAGTVPTGVTVVDDTVNQQVIAYHPGLRVFIPGLNTNEIVVAAATPEIWSRGRWDNRRQRGFSKCHKRGL